MPDERQSVISLQQPAASDKLAKTEQNRRRHTMQAKRHSYAHELDYVNIDVELDALLLRDKKHRDSKHITTTSSSSKPTHSSLRFDQFASKVSN